MGNVYLVTPHHAVKSAITASKCETLHTHNRVFAPLWIPTIKFAALRVIMEVNDVVKRKKNKMKVRKKERKKMK